MIATTTTAMIRYGPMSIVLLCAALYGVLRAGMLCCIPVNRRANRLMAALIVVLALYTAPYTIGYAGYYDAYPWLSFAPYNLTLAIGPLLYFYVRALQSGESALPRRWRLHFLPALLQFAYYCVMFSQPIGFKNAWNGSVHEPLIDPLEMAGLALSLAVYWRLAHRALKRQPTVPAEWGRNFLLAMGLSILIWYGMLVLEWACSGLSYFQRFPFYMWLSMLVCHLGSEACRQGAVALPPATPGPAQAADRESPSTPGQAMLGQRWRGAMVDAQWWRDPELNLAGLARHLGTNTTALSRAFNEGLGMNFNEVLNRIRVDAVLAALQRQAGRLRFRPNAGKLYRVEPRPERFIGQVFLLVGPENSSAAFSVARLAQQWKAATLVGQPTGGNLRGLNGGQIAWVTLPHSGVAVDIPLLASTYEAGTPDASVIPDLLVRRTFAGQAAGRDEEMAAVAPLGGMNAR